MIREVFQDIIIEAFLNNEIKTSEFISLSEKIESFSEGKLEAIKRAFKISQNITSIQKFLPGLKKHLTTANPKQKAELLTKIKNMEARLVKLKRIKAGIYSGGGTAVVATGIGTANED